MLIFAHRGASGEFPENTIEAYQQALLQGADGIELDAHFHHQGKFILLHDRYVDQASATAGLIRQYDLTEIKSFNAGNGQQIPTLLEALTAINGRCMVNIELKDATANSQQITEILQLLASKLNYAVKHCNFSWQQLIISSFNHVLLSQVKSVLPKVKLGALTASCPLQLAQFAQNLNADTMNPTINCINQALVDDAHQKGKQVWVYTVDKTTDIQTCIELGVDGIFSNYPAKVRKLLKEMKND